MVSLSHGNTIYHLVSRDDFWRAWERSSYKNKHFVTTEKIGASGRSVIVNPYGPGYLVLALDRDGKIFPGFREDFLDTEFLTSTPIETL